MLRFAILKAVEEGGREGSTVVLEYNEEQILDRLQARTRENLSNVENVRRGRFTKRVVEVKREWDMDTVLGAQKKAFGDLVAEFKQRTVTLR